MPLTDLIAAIQRADPADAPALLAAIASLLAEHPATPATADSDNDMLLTVNEAATLLRRDPKWLYRHRNLPFVRKVGNGLRISKRGLERWLDHQKVA